MNDMSNTPAAAEPQSLRKQMDNLAIQLEGRLSQIVSLLDVAMDVFPPNITDDDRRDAENATNLIYIGLDRAREALKLAGRVEVLSRNIPAEVTA